MKTNYFLMLGLLLASAICSATAATGETNFLGTNALLSLRPSSDQLQLEPLKLALKPIRLSLDVEPGKSRPGSWFERKQGPLASPSIDWAERLNAQDIRLQRERWIEVEKAPGAVHLPALYPSKPLETLDSIK